MYKPGILFMVHVHTIGIHLSPKYNAAEHGIPSGSILFAKRIEKWNTKYLLILLKMNLDLSK